MSLLLTFNGQNYIIPTTGEVGWGQNLDDYLVALAAGSFQKTGGSFTLSAEADFGGAFGLKSLYFKSKTANPAFSGVLRLANGDFINWRNGTNSGDVGLTVNTSNQLVFNGTLVQQVNLTSAHILVGNAGNIATDVAMTGDVSITNAGLTAVNNVQNLVITDAMINASASISLTKLAALTASRVLVSDGSGIISPSTVTAATLAFLDATSSIQTQLNGKLNLTGGTLTDNLTIDRNIASPTILKLTQSAGSGGPYSSQVIVENNAGHDAILAMYGASNGGSIFGQSVANSASLTTSGTSDKLFLQVQSSGSIWLGVGASSKLEIYATTTISRQPFNISPTSNQLILGGAGPTNTITISAPTPSANRIYTIPDAGVDTFFILSGSNQTLSGQKTFTSPILEANGTGSNPSYSFTNFPTKGLFADSNILSLAVSGIQAVLVKDTGATSIYGTQAGDDATAGYVGEYITSANIAGYTVPTSGLYSDLVSITLTAGDWDLEGMISVRQNSATFTSTVFELGLGGTASGNSTTGLIEGINWYQVNTVVPTGFNRYPISATRYRVSITSTTIYYLKVYISTFTAGHPIIYGNITARRVR